MHHSPNNIEKHCKGVDKQVQRRSNEAGCLTQKTPGLTKVQAFNFIRVVILFPDLVSLLARSACVTSGQTSLPVCQNDPPKQPNASLPSQNRFPYADS